MLAVSSSTSNAVPAARRHVGRITDDPAEIFVREGAGENQLEGWIKLFDSTESDNAASTPTSGYEREIVIVPFGAGVGLRKYVAPTPESKLYPADP